MTDLTTEQRATPSSDSTTETGKESSRQSGTVVANGIELFYESRGRTEDPAVLLIMGLGTQMTGWPENFCAQLCGHGFRVIRFDNRDIGLSQKMDGQKAPSPVTQVLAKCRPGKALFGRGVPYTLFDMANDTLGLLDQLGIQKVHVVGASMGGMIAQILSARHPERVASLTSIMSGPSWWGTRPHVTRHLLQRPGSSHEARIAHSIKTWQLIGSPGWPQSEVEIRRKVEASMARSDYPAGYSRQLAAVIATGDRRKLLRSIAVPTLVIHGDSDVMMPLSRGRATAKHIPGAKLEVIKGMGHNFPEALHGMIAQLIADHASAAIPVPEHF